MTWGVLATTVVDGQELSSIMVWIMVRGRGAGHDQDGLGSRRCCESMLARLLTAWGAEVYP